MKAHEKLQSPVVRDKRLHEWLKTARKCDNEPHDAQSSIRALEELQVLGVSIDHGRKKHRFSGAI